MAVTATPVFTQTPRIASIAATATASSGTLIFTAGGTGSKITGIWGVNLDSVIHVVKLEYNSNKTLIAASVASQAGNDGTIAATNLLSTTLNPGLPVDNDGQAYFFLAANDTIRAYCSTGAVTSGVQITIIGADF